MWPAVPTMRRAGAGGLALSRLNLVAPHEALESLRKQDAAVRLLVVFEQRKGCPGKRNRGSVQGVHELIFLRAPAPKADAQASCLVVRTVRRTRDLAVRTRFAPSGHPRFEVELAVGGSAEVAGRDVHHAVGDLELLVDFFLEHHQVLVHGLGVLWPREGEHLHLRELMDPVKTFALAPVRSGLGAEAVREPRELQGELLLVENRVRVETPERDLRGTD